MNFQKVSKALFQDFGLTWVDQDSIQDIINYFFTGPFTCQTPNFILDQEDPNKGLVKLLFPFPPSMKEKKRKKKTFW